MDTDQNIFKLLSASIKSIKATREDGVFHLHLHTKSGGKSGKKVESGAKEVIAQGNTACTVSVIKGDTKRITSISASLRAIVTEAGSIILAVDAESIRMKKGDSLIVEIHHPLILVASQEMTCRSKPFYVKGEGWYIPPEEDS